MQVFLDGWVMLGRYADALFLLAVSSLGMGVWAARWMGGAVDRRLGLFLALSLCVGTVPLASLAMAAVIVGRLLPGTLSAGMTVVTLLGAGGFLLWLGVDRPWPKTRSEWLPLVGGGAFFLLLLIVRLAFLRGLLLPPYSDGAAHYLVVRDLLQAGSAPALTHSLGNILRQYYHFGFHSLTAWLVWPTGHSPEELLPLLGQWFVCLPMLAVLCFLTRASEDWPASLFAALWAALAWKMPAFAANWAKYPALSGLAVFPAVLALLGSPIPVQRRRWSLLGAVLLIGGTLLLHARLAVLLGLAGLGLLIVCGLDRWPGAGARPWLAGVFVAGAVLLFVFQTNLLWVYGGGVFFPLALTALLLPFAVLRFPRLTTGVALFAIGLILALRLPVPERLQFYGAATWLDEPFLNLCFYLPLSALAGLGAAGLWRILARRKFLQAMLALLMIAMAVGSLWRGGTLSPNACCNYVQESDLRAVEWIDQNLPEGANLIAAGLPIPKSIMATDAGVWGGALTGRPVVLLPYYYAWDEADAHAEICTLGAGYIYLDNQPYSFLRERLARGDWYQPVYARGDEVIYRVRDCR